MVLGISQGGPTQEKRIQNRRDQVPETGHRAEKPAAHWEASRDQRGSQAQSKLEDKAHWGQLAEAGGSAASLEGLLRGPAQFFLEKSPGWVGRTVLSSCLPISFQCLLWTEPRGSQGTRWHGEMQPIGSAFTGRWQARKGPRQRWRQTGQDRWTILRKGEKKLDLYLMAFKK